MTVVIRPSTSVFQRTAPLVVVFGAFREIESPNTLTNQDIELIRGVVTSARRYHTPLAFTRQLPPDRSMPAGTWLPECRPRVTDRVFQHVEESCFSNREFATLFEKITPRKIYFTGPASDSSLTVSLADQHTLDRSVQVITSDTALQNCSASTANRATIDSVLPQLPQIKNLSFQFWLNELRQVKVE